MKTLLIAFLLFAGCGSITDFDGPDAAAKLAAAEIEVGSTVITTRTAAIYRRPDTSSTYIIDLQESEKGTVTRTMNNNMWRVRFSDVHGWTLASNIALSDTTIPPPENKLFLGGAGCSMFRDQLDPGIRDNVEGIGAWLKAAPNGKKVLRSYSGGTISAWGGGDNIKWKAFDTGLAEWPQTNILLYEVCIDFADLENDVAYFLPHVKYIADEIASRVDTADVKLFVIGQPDYTPEHTCSITGTKGAAFAQDIAKMMADSTWATAADFVLGPLAPEDIRANDDCHVNASGAKKEALQIEAWLARLAAGQRH